MGVVSYLILLVLFVPLTAQLIVGIEELEESVMTATRKQEEAISELKMLV